MDNAERIKEIELELNIMTEQYEALKQKVREYFNMKEHNLFHTENMMELKEVVK